MCVCVCVCVCVCDLHCGVVKEASLGEDGYQCHHSKQQANGVQIYPLHNLIQTGPLREREREMVIVMHTYM